MATQIEVLASIQELDTRIIKLEREICDIPARQEQINAKNNHLRDVIVQTKEKLSREHAKAKQLELDIESNRGKISKLREQQLQLKTNKEFKVMEEEIKAVEGKISSIEDEEIRVFELVDVINAELATADSELKKADALSGQDLAEMEKRELAIKAELNDLKNQRAIKAANANPDWLVHYNRILASKGNALVRIEHGTCGGCHMTLPPHVIHAARKADSLTSCSFCGRLLY